MPRFAVAAARARAGSGRPVPPWHAADLLDDEPRLHAGESVVSVCGVPELRVFPLEWAGVIASNGCSDCRRLTAASSATPA